MYCKECGNKIEAGSEFCDSCGKKVDSKSEELSIGKNDQNSKTISPLTISISKLVVLTILTFGIYEIYWFYKQWKCLKVIKNLNITVWARGLFTPLFAYPLFKQYFELAKQETQRNYPSAKWLAIGYFVLNLLWRSEKPYWLLGFTAVFTLIPVQKAINEYWVIRHPKHKIDSTYKGWETIILIIGGVFTLFLIMGLLA